jgi:hydroxymethylbilane synthase
MAWVGALADPASWTQVSAERTVSRLLGGSCRVPLAAYCVADVTGGLRLRACVASVDGSRLVEADERAQGTDIATAEALGERVARLLLDQGAAELLPAPG